MLLYGLAMAGGAIAYIPFLTILLPLRVTEMSGGADVQWLAYITFFGAIAASLANIAFGWLSDRTRNRTVWIAFGLVLSSAMLVSMAWAQNVLAMIALIIGWQIALNMMLAPLVAWAGDHVPDHQKGTLGGVLAFAPAMGAAAGVVVTMPGLVSADARLCLTAGMVALCVLPALLFGRPRHFPELVEPEDDGRSHQVRLGTKTVVIRMWLARLLIQISEAALFAYLYFWFRSVDPVMGDTEVARSFGVVLFLSAPLALAAGRWADLRERAMMLLATLAGLACLGLFAMALSASLFAALAGYVLFGVASNIFLALHTGQTLRVLPKPQNRGRDLGLFNLTNTSPSLIMPWLAVSIVPDSGFGPLFALLGCLAFFAALLLLPFSGKR